MKSDILLFGKKNKSGIARWITLFILVVTIVVKIFTKNGTYLVATWKFKNKDLNFSKGYYCHFSLYGAVGANQTDEDEMETYRQYFDCITINTIRKGEQIKKLTFGTKTKSTQGTLLIEGRMKKNSESKNISRFMKRLLLSPDIDIADCGNIFVGAAGECYS